MIRGIVASSRPISWVNTAYPFAAAYLLAGGGVDWRFVLGTVFFLFPYNLLMYGINDVFDYESDLRNPRKGGIEGALLSRQSHKALLIACVACAVPFLVVLAAAGSLVANLVLAVSIFAVLAYSAPRLRFKERPGLDSLTSAVHFVSPAVYGWVLAGASVQPGQWLVFGAFLLWGMASHALGAIQDIIPDRQGGLSSIATALSARTTIWLVLAGYVLAGVLVVAGVQGIGRWSSLLALPYVLNVLPHLGVSDASSGTVNRGWKRFLWINYLCGFLLTMLLIFSALFT
ncbi:4-hydroxybenzoate polyprenyltransferase [Glutamicibacter mysorens]|uniref:4-hydroxybenzoate polyprenyltransferase n=1 Tax=Glutamicibacter mysorens TaxID=257984 RepID=A0ABX4MVR1_9MICC|nr:prenyltransferase [Glutamicibacter mysorens]PJJ43599.1 4-hydroxybenzoate polyprenyltransferase [Glutamicibacter mysorens]